MLAKSCQSPRLTPEIIGEMPFRKRRTLLSEVVMLHFGDNAEWVLTIVEIKTAGTQTRLRNKRELPRNTPR